MAPPPRSSQQRVFAPPSVASSSRFSSSGGKNNNTSLYRDVEWGPRQWSSPNGAASVYSFRMDSYDIQDYTTVKRRNNNNYNGIADRRKKPSGKVGPVSKISANTTKSSSKAGASSTGSSQKKPARTIQCHRPPSPRPTLKESNAMEISATKKKMPPRVPTQHKIRNPPKFPLSSASASKAAASSKNSGRSGGPPKYPKIPASLASKQIVHKTLNKPFPPSSTTTTTPSVKTHSSLMGATTHTHRTTQSAKTSTGTTSMAPSTKTTRTSTSEPCSPRHVKWTLPSFKSNDSADDKDENLQPVSLTLLEKEKTKKKKNSNRRLRRPWTNPRNRAPNRPKPQLALPMKAEEAQERDEEEEEEEVVRVHADEDEDDDDDNLDEEEEEESEQNSGDSPGPPTHIAHRRIRKLPFTKRFLMRKAEEQEAISHSSKKSKTSQKSKSSQKNKSSSDQGKHGTVSVKSKSSSKKSASSREKTGGDKVANDLENNNRKLVPRGVSPKTTVLRKEKDMVEELLGLVQLPHPDEENAGGKKQPPTPQMKQLTIEDARDLLGDKDSLKIFTPNPNANIVLANNFGKKPKGFRWIWRERQPRQKLRKINKVQLQKWLEYAQGAIDEAYIEGVVEADSSLSSYYSNMSGDGSETGLSHILDGVGVEDVRLLFAEAQGHHVGTFADTTTLATLATDDARSISSVEIMFNWLTCNNNDDEMQFVEVQESVEESVAANNKDESGGGGYEGAVVFHKGAKSSAVSTAVQCVPIMLCM